MIFLFIFLFISITFMLPVVALIIFLICEILIFFYNFYLVILNHFIVEEKEKVKLNEEKFKKASPIEKITSIIAFAFSAFGSMCSVVIENILLKHMKSSQRRGNEKYISNLTEFDPVMEKFPECTEKEEIGYYIVDRYNDKMKNKIFVTN